MPRPADHPSSGDLQAYGLGRLKDAELFQQIERHIEGCAQCCQQAAAVTNDAFLDRARVAGAAGHQQDLWEASAVLPSMSGSDATTPPVIPDLPPQLAASAQYEIMAELGRGGMGVVYLAKNKLMGRQEVLKVVNQKLLDRSWGHERFRREIQSVAMLNHPNVVTAYSVVPIGELLVLSMEYIEGEDLALLVKRRGPLPVANACYYAQQVALGLQHAFEHKMVHRDIKPQNLILCRKHNKHIVKVLDFGLAKLKTVNTEERELTRTGQALGTPDYMAPEQILDAANADTRADIYSLGCTVFFLLTGNPPFPRKSLYEVFEAHQSADAKPLNLVRAEVPLELAAVVQKMMAKGPAQRYQTPIQAAQALAPFIRRRASEIQASEAPESILKTGRKQKAAPSHADTPPASDTHISASTASIDSPATKRPSYQSDRSIKTILTQHKWLAGAAATSLVLVLGFLAFWAMTALKVKTRDGTIVLEKLPSDAEVLVDDQKVTVTFADAKTAEIRVVPGRHKIAASKAGTSFKLEVVRDGVRVVGDEVEVADGGRTILTVSLSAPVRPSSHSMKVEASSATSRPQIFGGTWKHQGDELVQVSNRAGNAQVVFGDPSWTDYDISLEACRDTGDGFINVSFRCQDENNGYFFCPTCFNNTVACIGLLHAEHHKTFEAGYEPSDYKTFESAERRLENNRWYRVRVQVRGNHFATYLDDQKLFDHFDDQFLKGRVSLGCRDSACRFRNLQVTGPDHKMLWSGVPHIGESPDRSGAQPPSSAMAPSTSVPRPPEP